MDIGNNTGMLQLQTVLSEVVRYSFHLDPLAWLLVTVTVGIP